MTATEPTADGPGARGRAADRVRARFRDEAAGPPNGTEVAMRCSAHGRFIHWTHPPLPPVTIGCPPACGVDPADQAGPILRPVTL